MKKEDIYVRLAELSDLDFLSQDDYLPKDVVKRKIEQKECFILFVDYQPAGYLWMDYFWSLLPFIILIHILEAYQKHGYSRHFLEFVEEYLRNMGFDVLFSSSQVDDPNLQAWYRHMGFEECGIINGINDGGIGEVFFRKYL
jgi:GNAT superfamily N-acetyltransferase